MGLTEDGEFHLNINDPQPAYQALMKLCTKSIFQVTALQRTDGCLI